MLQKQYVPRENEEFSKINILYLLLRGLVFMTGYLKMFRL